MDLICFLLLYLQFQPYWWPVNQKKISIIIQDNKIVFSNTLGDVSALNPINGRLLWQTPTQNKSIYEAEIDAICELCDFLRFNVDYYNQILDKQPRQANSNDIVNVSQYNALPGFTAAITPFNFTAIGGNLASAPLLFGNSFGKMVV